jgi:excisionase family DNA binding protein
VDTEFCGCYACVQMRTFATDDTLLTIDEVMQYLRVDESTVHRMIARGELPVLRLGGHPGRPLRFRARDIRAALAGWETR